MSRRERRRAEAAQRAQKHRKQKNTEERTDMIFYTARIREVTKSLLRVQDACGSKAVMSAIDELREEYGEEFAKALMIDLMRVRGIPVETHLIDDDGLWIGPLMSRRKS